MYRVKKADVVAITKRLMDMGYFRDDEVNMELLFDMFDTNEIEVYDNY